MQQSAAPPFTKSTRFNDLPDDVKKTFEAIEYASCSPAFLDLTLSAVHTSKAEYKSAKIFTNENWAKRRPRAKNFYGASIEYAPRHMSYPYTEMLKTKLKGITQLDFRDPL